jgi:hypothetical protein
MLQRGAYTIAAHISEIKHNQSETWHYTLSSNHP